MFRLQVLKPLGKLEGAVFGYIEMNIILLLPIFFPASHKDDVTAFGENADYT